MHESSLNSDGSYHTWHHHLLLNRHGISLIHCTYLLDEVLNNLGGVCWIGTYLID